MSTSDIDGLAQAIARLGAQLDRAADTAMAAVQEATTGIRPAAVTDTHFISLILLTSEYLSRDECHDLREAALEYAENLRLTFAADSRD